MRECEFTFKAEEFRLVKIRLTEDDSQMCYSNMLDIAYEMVGEGEGTHLFIPGVEAEVWQLEGTDWEKV